MQRIFSMTPNTGAIERKKKKKKKLFNWTSPNKNVCSSKNTIIK